LIAPTMRDHRLLVFRKQQSAPHAFHPFRMAIAFRIGKFREKHIGSAGMADDVAEYDIRHIFHWRQHEKWTRQVAPKISCHVEFHSFHSLTNSEGKQTAIESAGYPD